MRSMLAAGEGLTAPMTLAESQEREMKVARHSWTPPRTQSWTTVRTHARLRP